ncbi:hypothetical protein SCHPADRAFT_891926 [Schizopora paradoxa]|uniref:Uncharacterized protein n=1 Tax=Schizopora paradoxa TaxID=27342 RepID=A0A0H2RGP4_9AGAM|nr:hypothetical protein SCHPADRAFT_891926 [Schizopora paradoxa]
MVVEGKEANRRVPALRRRVSSGRVDIARTAHPWATTTSTTTTLDEHQGYATDEGNPGKLVSRRFPNSDFTPTSTFALSNAHNDTSKLLWEVLDSQERLPSSLKHPQASLTNAGKRIGLIGGQGMHAITAGKYPAILYEENGAEYDRKKMLKGVWQAQVHRGEASSYQDDDSHNRLYDDPAMDRGGEHDGNFSELNFYNNICSFLTKNEKPSAKDSFFKFYHVVFNILSNTADSTSPSDYNDVSNGLHEMQQQLKEDVRPGSTR